MTKVKNGEDFENPIQLEQAEAIYTLGPRLLSCPFYDPTLQVHPRSSQPTLTGCLLPTSVSPVLPWTGTALEI